MRMVEAEHHDVEIRREREVAPRLFEPAQVPVDEDQDDDIR